MRRQKRTLNNSQFRTGEKLFQLVSKVRYRWATPLLILFRASQQRGAFARDEYYVCVSDFRCAPLLSSIYTQRMRDCRCLQLCYSAARMLPKNVSFCHSKKCNPNDGRWWLMANWRFGLWRKLTFEHPSNAFRLIQISAQLFWDRLRDDGR